jgi:hypothetical protein
MDPRQRHLSREWRSKNAEVSRRRKHGIGDRGVGSYAVLATMGNECSSGNALPNS